MKIKVGSGHIMMIAIYVVSFVVLGCAAHSLYGTGIVRSETPSLEIPPYINTIDWIALFCSFAIAAVVTIMWVLSRGNKRVMKVMLAGLVALLVLWGAAAASYSRYLEENNAASVPGNMDKANFAEITLYTFEEYFTLTDDDIPLYIGKTECPECEAFEDEITPFLEKNIFAVNTYVTDSDRDGPGSEAMYALLEEHDITSVPTFIVIRDGKIVKRWDAPSAELEEIEGYLTEWLRNHP
jgi:hypothetical protein